MNLTIRLCTPADVAGAAAVWNEAVQEGISLPQDTPLTEEEAFAFFLRTHKTSVALDLDTNEVIGLSMFAAAYPGHADTVAAGTWAVTGKCRGLRYDEQLLLDTLGRAKKAGYTLLVVPAVPTNNTPALKLLKKLGFIKLGELPNAFRLPDGATANLTQHYYTL